jgi:hypothetical protein
VNDVFTADDSLLDALDSVSKVTLAPNEEDALSADVDLLASEYLLFNGIPSYLDSQTHSFVYSLRKCPRHISLP